MLNPNPKPRAEVQRRMALFALAHPIRFALLSGLAGALWAFAIVGDARAGGAAGIGMTVLVWLAWNRRGFLRRRELRLYDPEGRPKTESLLGAANVDRADQPVQNHSHDEDD